MVDRPDCRVWQLRTQDFFWVKNSAPCKKIAKNFRAPAAPSRLRLGFCKTSETLHFHFLCS